MRPTIDLIVWLCLLCLLTIGGCSQAHAAEPTTKPTATTVFCSFEVVGDPKSGRIGPPPGGIDLEKCATWPEMLDILKDGDLELYREGYRQGYQDGQRARFAF